VVKTLCAILDELHPGSPVTPHASLMTFVKDRPGHDLRYAIDARKIEAELAWRPQQSFEQGIRQTVRWYLDNAQWTERVRSGGYRDWIDQNYGQRLEGRARP
jgi:dTDP-glucose 4,6-dehydratase